MVGFVRFLCDFLKVSNAKETQSCFFLFGGISWIMHNGLNREFSKWVQVSLTIGDFQNGHSHSPNLCLFILSTTLLVCCSVR